MTIIPELEKAIGTFAPAGPTYSPEDDDTIFRYYGKVETALIHKHIDTKKHPGRSCIRNRYNRLKKTGYKLADSLPADKQAPPTNEEAPAMPAEKKKGNKYGIPREIYSTDKKKYQRLWSRCRDLGITYEEALKLEGKTTHGPKRLKKSAAKKQREKPKNVEKIQPDTPPCNESKPLAQAIPSSNEATEAPPAAPPDPFRIGVTVRYTGSDPRISGTGQVKRAPQKSNQVLVQFSNALEWVLRSNLEAVPV
jgi:hypothetical protein